MEEVRKYEIPNWVTSQSCCFLSYLSFINSPNYLKFPLNNHLKYHLKFLKALTILILDETSCNWSSVVINATLFQTYSSTQGAFLESFIAVFVQIFTALVFVDEKFLK